MRGEQLGVGQGQQGTSKTLGGLIQLNFESTSKSRSSLSYIGHPGYIRSPILMFHIWLERYFHRDYNGTGPMTK
jgi:hypothetical protein